MRTLAAIVLQRLQHVFQAHDGNGLDVTRLAQSGRQQRARQVPLVGAHFAQRQPLAHLGDEVPVQAFVVAELECCFCPLLRAERGKKAAGGFRHQRSRVDVVLYAARRALATVLKTVAHIPRHQTAAQDRSGQPQKPASFDFAHISPFPEIPAPRRMRRRLDLNQYLHFGMLSPSSIHSTLVRNRRSAPQAGSHIHRFCDHGFFL